MSEGRGLRAYISRTFNLYQWAGAKSLISSGKGIRGLFHEMTRVKQAVRKETFAQAIVRLQLTPKDIQKKEKQYRMSSSIYGLFFVFGLIYTTLLFRRSDWSTGFMGLSYSFLMFGFFFRESFWYMQIKNRKLGMQIVDWCYFIVGMTRQAKLTQREY